MSSFIKNAIILLGLVALMAIGYYLFVMQGDSPAALRDGLVVSQADVEGKEFLTRLSELESMTLDTSILSDERMRNLTDNSKPLPNLPVGRSNPFADVN